MPISLAKQVPFRYRQSVGPVSTLGCRYGVARVFGATRAGNANLSPVGSPRTPGDFESC
jgi:hypothetical protein